MFQAIAMYDRQEVGYGEAETADDAAVMCAGSVPSVYPDHDVDIYIHENEGFVASTGMRRFAQTTITRGTKFIHNTRKDANGSPLRCVVIAVRQWRLNWKEEGKEKSRTWFGNHEISKYVREVIA